jgi:glycosyltransferase involved in cell wall biosynthesis
MVGLALIIKPGESKLLDNCLKSIAKYVDNIYITITGEDKEIEKVCQKYKAHISYFKWIDDFAAARNFNFSQVKDEWIVWCDADDIIEGAEHIKSTIKKMIEEGVDVGVMDYLYDFDSSGNCVVKHKKGRIVKNDGCVKWVGKLHEDLIDQRNIIAYFIPDTKIIHQSNNERYNEAKERNLRIAIKAYKEENDPRNSYNVANAYLSLGELKKAIKYFLEFREVSGSSIEIFTANDRIAGCYMNLGDYENAKKFAMYCISFKPNFPDGYLKMGEINFNLRNFKDAKEFLLTGFSKGVPEDEYIVYNPRDYDFNPLRILADCYLALNRPEESKMCLEKCLEIFPGHKGIKERIKMLDDEIKKLKVVDEVLEKIKGKSISQIKKLLDSVPDELKQHPKLLSVRNQYFIKTKSSGKDLAIFCFYTDEEFNPDIVINEGRGGSEEAVVYISQLLAERGWNVEVFANCGHKEQKYGKVTWKPFWSYNYRDKYDVFIAWRHPSAFSLDINATKKYLWMHDVLRETEFTQERLKKIDKIFALSKFQRSLLPKIPDDKFLITSNGITQDFPKTERDPNRLVYTSSYDRGLECLLKMFPEIKKECPKAELHIFYGWHVWDNSYKDEPEMKKRKEHIIKLMNQDGVYEHGRLSQKDIIKEYGKATAWVYPTHFEEISCITAMKAQAMGAIPITTNYAALDETVRFGLKVDTENIYTDSSAQDEFIQGAINILNKPPTEEDRDEMKQWARKHFSWEKVAEQWNNLFQNNTKEKE